MNAFDVRPPSDVSSFRLHPSALPPPLINASFIRRLISCPGNFANFLLIKRRLSDALLCRQISEIASSVNSFRDAHRLHEHHSLHSCSGGKGSRKSSCAKGTTGCCGERTSFAKTGRAKEI